MDYLDLLGVPYYPSGRDVKTGLDCWGLAMELYRRQGKQLPDPFATSTRPLPCSGTEWLVAAYGAWQRVDEPVVGCAVAMSIRGHVDHIGVVVAPRTVMHSMRNVGVVMHSLDREPIAGRVRGFYVYAG